jgi:uncharacterized protein (TIGR03086 family)
MASDGPAPDLRALHERACLRFVDYVGRIQAHQWTAPTPCADWDVRALVDHVVRWNVLVPEFLAGQSIDDMEAPLARDVLGDDPVAAAAASVRIAVEAFTRDGALEMIVHHPLGEIPGSQMLFNRVFDNTIHAWDLARGLGIDDQMDPETASLLFAVSDSQRAQIRASGAFGPEEIPVPADADVQTRLLGVLGRRQ